MFNALCKSWHTWAKANHESSKGTPVEAVVVPVNSTVLVKFVDVELLLLDEVIIADHNSCEWSHKARVTRQEGKQSRSVVNDIPRSRGNAEDADNDSGAEDVDVFRIQPTDVVTEGVGSYFV
jgi:hypothetical protein